MLGWFNWTTVNWGCCFRSKIQAKFNIQMQQIPPVLYYKVLYILFMYTVYFMRTTKYAEILNFARFDFTGVHCIYYIQKSQVHDFLDKTERRSYWSRWGYRLLRNGFDKRRSQHKHSFLIIRGKFRYYRHLADTTFFPIWNIQNHR